MQMMTNLQPKVGVSSKDPLQGASDRKSRKASPFGDAHEGSEFDQKLGSLSGAFASSDHKVSGGQPSSIQSHTGTNTHIEAAGPRRQRERLSASRHDAGLNSQPSLRPESSREARSHLKSMSHVGGNSKLSDAQGQALFDELSEYLPADVVEKLRMGDLRELSLNVSDSIAEEGSLVKLNDEGGVAGDQSLVQNGFIQTLNGLAKVSSDDQKGKRADQETLQTAMQRLGGSEFDSIGQGLDLNSVRGRKGMTFSGFESNLGQNTSFGQKDVNGFQAQVVSQSVSRPQFSEETLSLMSQQVMKTLQRGGGEFKMRINPDYLGEMTIHVRAQGNEVALRIQATDQRVKDILQESVASLQDKLSSQHLVLAQYDISVAPQSFDDQYHHAGQFSQRHDGLNQGWDHGFYQHQGSHEQGSRLKQGEETVQSVRTVQGRSGALSMTSPGIRSYSQKSGKLDLHA